MREVAEQSKTKGLQARRFTAEQTKEALKLSGTGLTKTRIARASGTTIESLRRWGSK